MYYCENNINVNGMREVKQLDKSRYELIEYFVLDKKAGLEKKEKRTNQ